MSYVQNVNKIIYNKINKISCSLLLIMAAIFYYQIITGLDCSEVTLYSPSKVCQTIFAASSTTSKFNFSKNGLLCSQEFFIHSNCTFCVVCNPDVLASYLYIFSIPGNDYVCMGCCITIDWQLCARRRQYLTEQQKRGAAQISLIKANTRSWLSSCFIFTLISVNL